MFIEKRAHSGDQRAVSLMERRKSGTRLRYQSEQSKRGGNRSDCNLRLV